MSTISNYVYGSDRYDQYKYASNVHNRKANNSVTSAKTVENGVKQEDPLESLVDSGTITEEQEDAIKAAFESAAKSTSYSRFKIQSNTENTESYDPLEALVENGTITENQKSAVKDLLDNQMKSGNIQPPPPPPQENNQFSLEDSLDDLVSSGTITGDQKSEVLKALQSAFEAGTTNTDGSSESDTTDPLQALVDAGTITKEQEAAIKNIFDNGIKSEKMPPPPPPENDGDSIDSILDSLVNNGTITDDQKTSILDALETNSSSESDSTDKDSTYQAYLKGLTELIDTFKTAINAYETQFEAGQDNSTINSQGEGVQI